VAEADADRTYLSVRSDDGCQIDLAEHGPERSEMQFQRMHGQLE
jgi:hypothetical protein